LSGGATKMRSMARVFAVLLVAGLTACAASNPPPAKPAPTAAPPAPSPALAQFVEEARKMGMTFEIPPCYAEVAVRDNEDQAYHYAVASADGRIEIRFTLLPFEGMAQEIRNKETLTMLFVTGVSNIVGADGKDGTFKDAPAAKDYFNADDAIMLILRWAQPSSRPAAFRHGYEAGAAIFIHRQEAGVANIFVLFKDRAAAAALREGTLNSLRFAAPRSAR